MLAPFGKEVLRAPEHGLYGRARAFYLDGNLHLIIGDFDNEGDRFRETVERSHGVTETKQYFKHGRRAKSAGFKGTIVGRAGVETHLDGKKNAAGTG